MRHLRRFPGIQSGMSSAADKCNQQQKANVARKEFEYTYPQVSESAVKMMLQGLQFATTW